MSIDGRDLISNSDRSRLLRMTSRARSHEFRRYWAGYLPDRVTMARHLEMLKRFHLGEDINFESLVEQRASKIATYAFASSPYYRQLFLDHNISPQSFLENLSRVPLLDKAVIRREGSNLLAMPQARADLAMCTTGGSTGEPLSFLACGGFDAAHQKFLFEMMGYRRRDRILAMDGSVVPSAVREQGVYWIRKSSRELPYGSFGLSSQYLTSGNIAQYFEFIQRFRPNFIRGYPSFIDTVSRHILENGLTVDFPVKGIQLTSESHSALQAENISRAFNSPTVDQYGHTESAVFGYSLPCATTIYCSPLNGYTEVLDENGKHVSPGGVGEVVVTGFHNYAMPFLRYKTGDLAQYESRQQGVVYPTKSSVP